VRVVVESHFDLGEIVVPGALTGQDGCQMPM
jgi:hypothetical protein